MAKGLSMAMDTPQTLGVSGILRESLHLPTRNVKLMVLNMLIVLITFSILALSHNLIARPYLIELEDHESNDSRDPKFQNDMGILMGLETIFFLAYCTLSLIAMATTMYASAATYTGKYLNMKDVVLRTVAIWKRPMITCVYIPLITISYALLVALLFGVIVLVIDGVALIAWISLVGFLAMFFYLYLAVVWLLGLVISIVEEDCYGIKALEKAMMIIKGRKLQGYSLMLFLVLLSSPISVLFSLNSVEDEIGMACQLTMGIVETCLVCLVIIFTFVVYTVFYYQCKRSHGEKEEMDEEEGYRLVSTNLHVNESLP